MDRQKIGIFFIYIRKKYYYYLFKCFKTTNIYIVPQKNMQGSVVISTCTSDLQYYKYLYVDKRSKTFTSLHQKFCIFDRLQGTQPTTVQVQVLICTSIWWKKKQVLWREKEKNLVNAFEINISYYLIFSNWFFSFNYLWHKISLKMSSFQKLYVYINAFIWIFLT